MKNIIFAFAALLFADCVMAGAYTLKGLDPTQSFEETEGVVSGLYEERDHNEYKSTGNVKTYWRMHDDWGKSTGKFTIGGYDVGYVRRNTDSEGTLIQFLLEGDVDRNSLVTALASRWGAEYWSDGKLPPELFVWSSRDSAYEYEATVKMVSRGAVVVLKASPVEAVDLSDF